ncbi:MAG: translation initiation factor IF-5A [Candidatus Helarchaeota archaeon]
MSKNIVDAGSLKPGKYILINNEPYKIISAEKSKPGKHGSAKVRFVAVNLYTDKKTSLNFPVDTKVETPIIDKRTAIVNSIMGDTLSLMDMETYNTFELEMPKNEELKSKIKEGVQVEYWNIVGRYHIEKVKG